MKTFIYHKACSFLSPFSFILSFFVFLARGRQREKVRSRFLVKHQAAGSHMLNQWFLTLHHLCTHSLLESKWLTRTFISSLWTLLRRFARTIPAIRPPYTSAYNMLSSDLDKVTVWVPLVIEELDGYPALTASPVSERCSSVSPLFGMLRGTERWGQSVSPSWHRPELVQGYSLI